MSTIFGSGYGKTKVKEKYALIKNGYSYIESIDHSDGGLWMGKNEALGNDRQLKNVLEKFPEVVEKIVNDTMSTV